VYKGPGDTTLLGEVLTIWPPELWALALLVVAALVTLGDRRSGLTIVIVTAAFLLATSEWTPLLRARNIEIGVSSSHSDRFRLVTWNVSRNPELAALEPLKADVCLFQEGAPVELQAARIVSWSWTSRCAEPVRAVRLFKGAV
jgi:hypothetical protein